MMAAGLVAANESQALRNASMPAFARKRSQDRNAIAQAQHWRRRVRRDRESSCRFWANAFEFQKELVEIVGRPLGLISHAKTSMDT